mmetsp:Transcript_32612/g.81190  ORF Transcript_32612/g.81190 Transcript_32612/m.81190 type:complete len:109 (-) Transcript_32612:1804-2130(-)
MPNHNVLFGGKLYPTPHQACLGAQLEVACSAWKRVSKKSTNGKSMDCSANKSRNSASLIRANLTVARVALHKGIRPKVDGGGFAPSATNACQMNNFDTYSNEEYQHIF